MSDLIPLSASSHSEYSAPYRAIMGPLSRVLTLAGMVLLASCGGGGGGGSSTGNGLPASDPDASLQISASMLPSDNSDAYRFLEQATFGPSPADVARVKKIGFDNWIEEQFALPITFSHLNTVKAGMQALNHTEPFPLMLTQSWWTHAVTNPAQLRQRVAFALSEIFVVSTVTVDTRMAASYLDMLTRKADANYRDLLEAVALHPAMGQYLSHLSNRKEDPTLGRVPDENFAREVMQLFSIGLYELDDSAHPIVSNGHYVETYSADDVKGMAKVFTGWGWYRSSSQMNVAWWLCFWRASECTTDEQFSTNMVGYDMEHSVSAKNFLGITIPAQSTPAPYASLKTALDRLASHHNTAPFISKQLIQHLVTSNPSDAYVSDITNVFRSTNGNLKAVVKAILLHAEARRPESVVADMSNFGKVREPVLRLTHLLRSLPHTSDTYNANHAFYLAVDTADPGTQLGQTPMQSPSVFNFFRPGYTPPQSSIANASLVAPEMQLSSETSTLGYANFVTDILENGWGNWVPATNRLDIQFDLSQWDNTATQSTVLIQTMANQLLGHALPDAQASMAASALDTMPADNARNKRRRVQAAILMVAVSPGFVVQQ
jgi:uncharacterized protein (DUF1800 family)